MSEFILRAAKLTGEGASHSARAGAVLKLQRHHQSDEAVPEIKTYLRTGRLDTPSRFRVGLFQDLQYLVEGVANFGVVA